MNIILSCFLVNLVLTIITFQGIGLEMERLAAKMGGTTKFPYNDSECLDADYFKVNRPGPSVRRQLKY